MSNRLLLVMGIAILLIASGCPSASDSPPPSPTDPPASGKTKDGEQQTNAAPLSAVESEAFLRKFNQAIALLENGEPAASAAIWDELSKQFPGELSIAQNRVVAGILALKKAASDRSNAAAQQATANVKATAEAALADLKKLDPDSAETDLLEARLAENSNSADRAASDKELARRLEALQRAAERDPKNPSLWLELGEALQSSRDRDAAKKAFAAYRRAYEFAPDNLAVLVPLLKADLDQKDPAIVGDLRSTLEELRSLSSQIAIRGKLDPAKKQDTISILEAAIAAAEKGEWTNPALNSVRGLRGHLNVLNGDDSTQSDMLAIERIDLELINSRLSDALKKRLAAPVATAETAAKIAFAAFPAPLSSVAAAGATDFVVADLTLDQKLDVAVLSPGQLKIFEKSDAGWAVTVEASVPEGLSRMVVFDLDDDHKEFPAALIPPNQANKSSEDRYKADLDFLLSGSAGLQIVLNRWDAAAGIRKLEAISAFPEITLSEVHDVAVFDSDIDSDLDLFVSAADGVHLLINLGNNTFLRGDDMLADVPAGLKFQSSSVVDFNRDVDLDLLICTADHRLAMFENLRHGLFRYRAIDAPRPAQVVDVAELDGNVSWDILTAADETLRVTATRTVARGDTQFLGTADYPSAGQVLGLIPLDVDNSAVTDVLTWSAAGPLLWRNDGTGRLTRTELSLATDAAPWKRVAVVDLDNDGLLDLAALVGDAIQFWKNESAPAGKSLDIRLLAKVNTDSGRAVASSRINHYGYGSLLELKAGDRYHAQTVRSPHTHFGLNGLDPDVVRVTWTNGIPQNIIKPQPDTSIVELQTLYGSCPYLYTWDGEKFVFVTDLLWAAPLGLTDANGQPIPWREWEYLKIPAKALQPKDGQYQIQITEELFEAGYFDEVRLIAVDHPADYDVFTNEKVGPPQLAEPKIHTARNLRTPVSMTDLRGRSLQELLVHADEAYARTWDTQFTQGFCETHGVELNLGDVAAAKTIKLFLTGWLRPTDPNISKSLLQNPNLDGPVPPSIEIPDGQGGWKTALDYMGFPGGKTKTIVIDVSDVVNRDDPRLRIVTSNEICWDQVAFTVDEPGESVIEQPLRLLSADLHHRGFSARRPDIPNGPEWYDYQRLQTEPKYTSMGGRFTKFGDVAELLTVWDDRIAVIGPGDEMTLTFAPPPTPLPEGWVRDFVIYSVGWDKDGQMNTLLGQIVEPMPFRAMTEYPPIDGIPETPEYLDYLRTWQTREMSDTRYRRMLKLDGKQVHYW